MEKSYYLQNVTVDAQKDPRHFLIPAEEEIAHLKVGEMVRLFFAFHFTSDDGCRAERMWVEISEINGDRFKGHLTNQPVYIKDLAIGNVIEFEKNNIASLIVKASFDEKKKAIITLKALEEKQVNWMVADSPYNEEDSGWQFFYGGEDDDYLSNPNHAAVVTLEEILRFEPRIEKALLSAHNAFEWSEEKGDFVAVHDFNG